MTLLVLAVTLITVHSRISAGELPPVYVEISKDGHGGLELFINSHKESLLGLSDRARKISREFDGYRVPVEIYATDAVSLAEIKEISDAVGAAGLNDYTIYNSFRRDGRLYRRAFSFEEEEVDPREVVIESNVSE